MDIVVVNDEQKDQITKEAFVLVSIAASLFFDWPHQCIFEESRRELHRPGGGEGPTLQCSAFLPVTVRILQCRRGTHPRKLVGLQCSKVSHLRVLLPPGGLRCSQTYSNLENMQWVISAAI